MDTFVIFTVPFGCVQRRHNKILVGRPGGIDRLHNCLTMGRSPPSMELATRRLWHWARHVRQDIYPAYN